ncbi:MAG: M13 family metallopeptidase [Bacilli bacterium]|nr:M13 family metallopeptidase [Bacilli bacterium]
MTKNKTKKYILYAIIFVVTIIAAFIYLNKNYIDNYYEYINKETIKDKEDGWSYIDDINKEISNDANNIVKEIINNPTTSEEKNIKELYNEYLNIEFRNKNGLKDLELYIDKINKTTNINDFITEAIKLEKGLSIELLMSKSIMKDFKTGKNILYITPIPMDYGYSSDYYSNETLTTVKNNFKLYNNKLLREYGYTDGEALDITNQIDDFYTNLANNSLKQDDLLNTEKYYNIIDKSALSKIYTNLDINKYFNELGLSKIDKLSLVDEKSYQELNKYLTNNNLSLWKNIATIKILQTYAEYTTENYETIFTKINKNLLGKEYTREETAYDLIKQIYPNEISKNYNNKYLSDDTKNYISNLTNEIIKEYEDMINTSWMDNETKSKAVTKLNNIKINIGTSYIKDLSSYYDFNSNISLVKNIINLNKVVRAASYEMLDTTTTTNALPDYTFNAYYDVTSNSINILTGSIKVMKDINNKYENLGSIGFIIAHEISHAFDNNGSKFDENGFLSNWYTTSSQEKYQEIQNKVIDYYNNYEIIHNVSNNGTRTIGENIADLGAMECITNILIKNNANKKDYQTTYESFAKVWANNYSKSTKVLQSLIDNHSPNEIRVNGVLSSTERFYETYKIDSKDLMYIEPEKRVNIWS